MSNYVEMWERVWFTTEGPVRWEKSWDQGQHWEDVNWLGEKLPFVLFNPVDIEYVVEKKLLPIEVFQASREKGDGK